jgi:hypothetical protein
MIFSRSKQRRRHVGAPDFTLDIFSRHLRSWMRHLAEAATAAGAGACSGAGMKEFLT